MPEIKPYTQPENPVIVQNTGTRPSGSQTHTAPPAEEKAAAPVEAPKEEKSLDSERFAALTKKEREIQKRARALQEKERNLSKWEEAEKLSGTNKLEAIKRLGISYDDLTNLHLSQMGADEQTPEAIASRKAQEIVDQRFEEFKKSHEEQLAAQQQQQLQWALQKAHSDSQAYTKGKEDFACLNAFDRHDMVVGLIQDSLQPESDFERVLTVPEAAEEVEKWFVNQAEELLKIEKIRSKYMPTSMQDEKQSAKAENTQKPQTLTHRNTTAPVNPRTYSGQERRDRAIRILNGQPVD